MMKRYVCGLILFVISLVFTISCKNAEPTSTAIDYSLINTPTISAIWVWSEALANGRTHHINGDKLYFGIQFSDKVIIGSTTNFKFDIGDPYYEANLASSSVGQTDDCYQSIPDYTTIICTYVIKTSNLNAADPTENYIRFKKSGSLSGTILNYNYRSQLINNQLTMGIGAMANPAVAIDDPYIVLGPSPSGTLMPTVNGTDRFLFTTSDEYNGNLDQAATNLGITNAANGNDAADQICNYHANRTESLYKGLKFKAILSDGLNSAQNQIGEISSTGRFRSIHLTTTEIAPTPTPRGLVNITDTGDTTASFISSGLSAYIGRQDETGNIKDGSNNLFASGYHTGGTPPGWSNTTCDDWNSNSASLSVTQGNINNTSAWIYSESGNNCSNSYRLLCVSVPYITWTGAGIPDGNNKLYWSDPENWSPKLVPGSGDNVQFDGTCINCNVTINQDVGTGTAPANRIELQSSFTGTITQSVNTIFTKKLIVNSGTINSTTNIEVFNELYVSDKPGIKINSHSGGHFIFRINDSPSIVAPNDGLIRVYDSSVFNNFTAYQSVSGKNILFLGTLNIYGDLTFGSQGYEFETESVDASYGTINYYGEKITASKICLSYPGCDSVLDIVIKTPTPAKVVNIYGGSSPGTAATIPGLIIESYANVKLNDNLVNYQIIQPPFSDRGLQINQSAELNLNGHTLFATTLNIVNEGKITMSSISAPGKILLSHYTVSTHPFPTIQYQLFNTTTGKIYFGDSQTTGSGKIGGISARIEGHSPAIVNKGHIYFQGAESDNSATNFEEALICTSTPGVCDFDSASTGLYDF